MLTQEGIESQAIDRCNRLGFVLVIVLVSYICSRIGQKKPVHVYQLIADNTVESKVIEIQERKKLLVQQVRHAIQVYFFAYPNTSGLLRYQAHRDTTREERGKTTRSITT
jgi:SNF2 family DNA or RNA helicase